MATRHLIVIRKDNKTKVAQFGWFDGYPEGAGLKLLLLLRNLDKEVIKKQLDNVRFLSTEETTNMTDDEIESIYPSYDMNWGSEILPIIYAIPEGKELVLKDSSAFANDTIFCQYCYIIDFDQNKFFVCIPSESNREKHEFGSMKAIASFNLSKLPSQYIYLRKIKVYA